MRCRDSSPSITASRRATARADVEVARRLADRIALTLSHHRLAEEARVAAEARERAERLEATVATLARELSTSQRRIVGVSSSWKAVLTQIGRVAPSETTVLIAGESGTGKEVVSRLLHEGSPRAGKPMVAVNCAALPEQLLESELFGHEKGAFTGAIATKIGRLEQAAGGTLFLDEIAEMSPLVQAKFLRALEQREFQRLGGTRLLRADVRVIAATNRDLQAAIKNGRFREDLYYRLAVFEIRVPALRERPEDILPLAESFLEELGRTMARPAAGISRDARDWLLAPPLAGQRSRAAQRDRARDPALRRRPHHARPSARRHQPRRVISEGARRLAGRGRAVARGRDRSRTRRARAGRESPGRGPRQQGEGRPPPRPHSRPALLAHREVRARLVAPQGGDSLASTRSRRENACDSSSPWKTDS